MYLCNLSRFATVELFFVYLSVYNGFFGGGTCLLVVIEDTTICTYVTLTFGMILSARFFENVLSHFIVLLLARALG